MGYSTNIISRKGTFGFTLGVSGTEAAREISDLILLNDDLSSLLSGVL